MIIAQISDTHIDLDSADVEHRIRDFDAVIDDINSLDPAPDLIVHTGDVVHNGRREEYERAVAVLEKAQVPVFAIVGNKDNRDGMREAFEDFGFVSPSSRFIDYAVDDFPVRLIMLDTLDTNSNKGAFCSERLQNLDKMLEDKTTRPTAVFMHHPPCEISVGPEPLHFGDPGEMSGLREALQRVGQVKSIFCGHVHRSTTGQVGNIPVMVTTAVATAVRWGEYSDHMKPHQTYFLHRYDEALGFVTETRIV